MSIHELNITVLNRCLSIQPARGCNGDPTGLRNCEVFTQCAPLRLKRSSATPLPAAPAPVNLQLHKVQLLPLWGC